MNEGQAFPYATFLNVLHGPLSLIDVPQLVDAVTDRWYNQTLCKVNDSVVRLGVLHHPPNLTGFDGLNLRTELERRLDRPVQVGHDSALAAYGECLLGAGRTHGVESLLMYTLGTGVGCGIILNREIWIGMQGAAGESGHGPIIPDGVPCPCGARGCLEMYASATSIVRRAHELGLALAPPASSTGNGAPPLTASAIAQLATTGDERALRIFDEVGYALGLSLAHLVNALDLPLYVVPTDRRTEARSTA